MRLCFNIELPKGNLQRIGGVDRKLVQIPEDAEPISVGALDSQGRLIGSSKRGYQNRDLSRFYPIVRCLETLCDINDWQLRRQRYAPLYQSGVVYREEPPGEEEWLDIPCLYKQGFGDCEDIACARVSELRRVGIAAVPCICWKEFDVGGKVVSLVHVLVLLPDDSIEDPSKVLGMKGSYSDTV